LNSTKKGDDIRRGRLSEAEEMPVSVLSFQCPLITDAITVTYLESHGEEGDVEVHGEFVGCLDKGRDGEEIGQQLIKEEFREEV
jgi:hypothetical protein